MLFYRLYKLLVLFEDITYVSNCKYVNNSKFFIKMEI